MACIGIVWFVSRDNTHILVVCSGGLLQQVICSGLFAETAYVFSIIADAALTWYDEAFENYPVRYPAYAITVSVVWVCQGQYVSIGYRINKAKPCICRRGEF